MGGGGSRTNSRILGEMRRTRQPRLRSSLARTATGPRIAQIHGSVVDTVVELKAVEPDLVFASPTSTVRPGAAVTCKLKGLASGRRRVAVFGEREAPLSRGGPRQANLTRSSSDHGVVIAESAASNAWVGPVG